MNKQNLIDFTRYKLPVIVWGLTIIGVSSIPDFPPINTEKNNLDKLAHLIEYGIFTYLLARAFYFSKKNFFRRKAIILTPFISVIFAAGDEIHQLAIPGRFGSLNDFFADLGGILLSLFLFIKIVKPFSYNENNQKHRDF
ncbi:hypothetical protein DRQ09_03940 [candidate division KSB1 bacterium]|nr:MAG: hypothetical protein DRQ09_03940 [candidate division KSB1 bacterium]